MIGEKKYPRVFSPMRIGPVEVSNRIYMPPHGLLPLTVGGPHASLVPSDQWGHYFAERAAGGVGLIVHSLSVPPRPRQASPLYSEAMPAYQVVADMVHRHGTKLFAQLMYLNRTSNPWEGTGGMVPTLGPTERQRLGTHSSVREISPAEIGMLIDQYRQCARNLSAVGYDGIEIHATHGTIHEQFLSPYFNKRTDGYGGDDHGRMRLLIETIEAVRAVSRPDMAMGLRLNVDEMIPGALTTDDTQRILRKLIERELIHFADLDVGVEPQQNWAVATNFLVPELFVSTHVRKVRAAGKGRIAMMAVGGRVTTLAQAEKLLSEDAVDMVGIVRGLLAEPELVKNAVQGHEERSRVCVAHNFCFTQSAATGGFGCVINPASGREGLWGVRTFTRAPSVRRVVVIGGGPAGLEAARVAALRGHEVILFEQRERLGGQVELWASTPGRQILRTTVSWYARRLADMRVLVYTGVTATTTSVMAEAPDAVIVAAGSHYDAAGHSAFSHDAIIGAERPNVYTPERILEDGVRPRGRVLILDELRDHAGPAIAQLLAEAGARVEIVSSADRVLGERDTIHFAMSYQLVPILDRLGVVRTPEHYIKEIGDNSITLQHAITGVERSGPVDAVVLITARLSQGRTLERELEGKVDQLYAVGDAAAPRSYLDATYDGQRFARLIGEPDAPRTTGEAIFSVVPEDAIQRSSATLLEGALNSASAESQENGAPNRDLT